MCVRTKTSYGCGCEYKTDAECYSSRCSGLERYHYPRSGDCKVCKQAGSALTRGRDGRGRYGQEIRRRSQSPQDGIESPAETMPESVDIGNGISPWASPSAYEKDWKSGIRSKADDAWLEEHSERNFDLQSIRETLPPYAPSARDPHSGTSPHRRPTRIYVREEDIPCDRGDGSPRRYQPDDYRQSLPYEIRSVRDDYDHASSSRVYYQRRHDSQESFESMPSSRSSARKYRTAPTSHIAYDHPESRDSGYGSYRSLQSESYGKAKTEPFQHSPLSQPRFVVAKLSSPPSYSTYHTGYGVGTTTAITREPVYEYSSRRY